VSNKKIVGLFVVSFIGFLATAFAVAGNDKNADALAEIMSMESDAEYGAYLSSECLTCHTPTGPNGAIPQIHGKAKDFLAIALLGYKNKQRDNEVMQGIAMALSNEDIAALVTYLSAE